MENNELLHWGIKGMKWGRRRYQNKDGTWTAAGKARRRDDDDDPNESLEQKKERILRSKSAEKIYKNSHLFTDQEINNAANRLSNEARIKALIPAKKPGLREKLGASIKSTVMPPLMEAGKKALAKKMEEAFGLKETKDPLKEVSEVLKLTENLDKLEKLTGKNYGSIITNKADSLGYKYTTKESKPEPVKSAMDVAIDKVKSIKARESAISDLQKILNSRVGPRKPGQDDEIVKLIDELRRGT